MAPTTAPAEAALARSFFERPTEEVAPAMLGMLLVRRSAEGETAGRIVEVEAYGGPEDRASHTRAGLTPRTAPMFGQVGHAYVYLVYGVHECLNVVAYRDRPAGAVLVRAMEPVAGVELMRARRGRRADSDARLAAGPARLCQAMAVDRTFSGHDLTTAELLWLAPGPLPPAAEIASGPRIGVAYAGDEWGLLPWRFWIRSHPSVSR